MTDEQLTAIYNEANGLDPKRHNPITTERIFAAMRAAMEVGCEERLQEMKDWTRKAVEAERKGCEAVCESVRKQYEGMGGWVGAQKCLMGVRARSNVEFRPLDAASSRPVAPGTQG